MVKSKKEMEKKVKETIDRNQITGNIFVIISIIMIGAYYLNSSNNRNPVFLMWGIMLLFTGIYIILLPQKFIKKQIEKRWEKEVHKEELRQAQLKALKKGKVNVEIKGKMVKIK